MKLINDLLRPLFDLLQAPLAGMPAFVGVLIWSIPVGVFTLWVFGKTSNQVRIAEVKRRIHAGLFEIRLFNDDLRAIMKAQWQILGHVIHYQALALKPMIFILPPLVLVMVQLHQFYGFRGLQPGEQAMMTVQLDPESVSGSSRPDISLELPEGVRVTTGPVWVPSLAQISWQLGIDAEGEFDLAITVDGETAKKSLRATDRLVRLSPERPPRTFVGQLEWPSEKPLEKTSKVHSISLGYPEAAIGILGWEFEWAFAWMVVFFVLTMVIALALRKPMGVEL
ncbi:MAG: hypothetical protein QNL88_16815 [Acidobacteriota bacterium]|nr:hypothetical protein [Acidobacteriota bacterium]